MGIFVETKADIYYFSSSMLILRIIFISSNAKFENFKLNIEYRLVRSSWNFDNYSNEQLSL